MPEFKKDMLEDPVISNCIYDSMQGNIFMDWDRKHMIYLI